MKKSDNNNRSERRVRVQFAARIGAEPAPPKGQEPVVDEMLPCTVSSLSLGGARVVVMSHRTLANCNRVRMSFDTGEIDNPLELSGMVRWREIAPGSPVQRLGVEFLVPAKDTLKRWVEHVEEVMADEPPEDSADFASDPWPW